jgi:hypothetical protein
MSQMRLYQRQSLQKISALFVLAALVACAAPAPTADEIAISLQADGDTRQLQLAAGSTVQTALTQAGVELGLLDRTEPAAFEALAGGETVRVIRVSEEFEVQQEAVPFVSRTLQNEALTPGEQRLIQNGINGSREVTYRLLYEDGELVSRTEVRSAILTEPVEEIIMIGAQSPFSSLSIAGRLAFLSAGNAWLLEENTGARRPVVTSGDLDGRVFEVSPDREWLLFSRASEVEGQINELWVASLDEGDNTLIDLSVGNVVHYAGWVPGGSNTQIAFSTVEPSLNPPGWQANNDLQFVNITAGGEVTQARVGLPAREDSLYAWWGTGYAWRPDGEALAFTRPDAVGSVDIDTDDLDIWLPLITYQTTSDWAWMPGLAWSPDGGLLYTVEHIEQEDLDIQERSPYFDLVAAYASGQTDTVASNVGMFAAPQASPEIDGAYMLAYLRAFTPAQSDISAYELVVDEADGGNPRALFPPAGAPGLQPQQVAWSPAGEGDSYIAFIYQGNLWLVDVNSGAAAQITGDSLVSAISWR